MDNLRAHKVQGVGEIIESAEAAILYLPPYSPNLNPIKQMRSAIKALLPVMKAGFVDASLSPIPKAFDKVSADDILSWFSSSAYWR